MTYGFVAGMGVGIGEGAMGFFLFLVFGHDMM